MRIETLVGGSSVHQHKEALLVYVRCSYDKPPPGVPGALILLIVIVLVVIWANIYQV